MLQSNQEAMHYNLVRKSLPIQISYRNITTNSTSSINQLRLNPKRYYMNHSLSISKQLCNLPRPYFYISLRPTIFCETHIGRQGFNFLLQQLSLNLKLARVAYMNTHIHSSPFGPWILLLTINTEYPTPQTSWHLLLYDS